MFVDIMIVLLMFVLSFLFGMLGPGVAFIAIPALGFFNNAREPQPKSKSKATQRREDAKTQRNRKAFLCEPFTALREIFCFLPKFALE